MCQVSEIHFVWKNPCFTAVRSHLLVCIRVVPSEASKPDAGNYTFGVQFILHIYSLEHDARHDTCVAQKTEKEQVCAQDSVFKCEGRFASDFFEIAASQHSRYQKVHIKKRARWNKQISGTCDTSKIDLESVARTP